MAKDLVNLLGDQQQPLALCPRLLHQAGGQPSFTVEGTSPQDAVRCNDRLRAGSGRVHGVPRLVGQGEHAVRHVVPVVRRMYGGLSCSRKTRRCACSGLDVTQRPAVSPPEAGAHTRPQGCDGVADGFNGRIIGWPSARGPAARGVVNVVVLQAQAAADVQARWRGQRCAHPDTSVSNTDTGTLSSKSRASMVDPKRRTRAWYTSRHGPRRGGGQRVPVDLVHFEATGGLA